MNYIDAKRTIILPVLEELVDYYNSRGYRAEISNSKFINDIPKMIFLIDQL